MQKVQRPKIIRSISREVKVGCGSLFVRIGETDGKVIEVIATLGRAGGCASAQNEALGRAISLGLRYGVPLEEYVEQLEDIRCPTPHMFPREELCLSCADGFAIALRENGFEKIS